MDDRTGMGFDKNMTTAPNTLARPTRNPLRTGTLLLATVTTGLTAGVYTDWSNTIMPGLGDVDDRTFVTAFQSLDAAIMNPLFLGVEFTGSLLLIALALALHMRSGQRATLVWLSVALAAYLVSVVITMGVNEPLNQQLRSVTDSTSDADFAAARAMLDEARWTAWNTVRALATLTAFGSLAWSLVIHQRR
ncbi:Uncharacterized membrane protein [Glycomyces harbinensis]|uniref:Uncharacterized membrane protein n=2 Tax=Glycomyces harbinensis TaxID=58114 RepID=A0A1G6XGC6_9ACTN|nr:Uncharacterized membrane protein [Glycomyces harbinensis]